MSANGSLLPFLTIGLFTGLSVFTTTSRMWLSRKMVRRKPWSMPAVPVRLPFVGVGWYRLDFEAPQFAKGKKATLLFDGAMSHARVYINGQEAGYWPYGYNSFQIDRHPLFESGREELTGCSFGKRYRVVALVSRSRVVPQCAPYHQRRGSHTYLGNPVDYARGRKPTMPR